MKRYRIRIGKATFNEPHYVTSVGDSPNYAMLSINKAPRSWKTLSVAQKHLRQILNHYQSAEIEEYEA